MLRCPDCAQPVVRVRTVTAHSQHYYCNGCSQVYTIERGWLVVCVRPGEHVISQWRDKLLSYLPPGAVLPGPNARGML